MAKPLTVIFVVACLIRLAALLVLPERGVVGDSISYDDLGWRLSQGEGYTRSLSPDEPDNRRLPGYPVFLAALYFLFGHSLLAVKIAQLILDSFTCILLYKLACFLFDRRAAFWAGLFAAVFPGYILFSNFILSETLFVFLVTLSVYALVWAFRKGLMSSCAVAGCVMGVATLVRSTLLLLPGFLLPFVFFRQRAARKTAFFCFILFICGMLLAMSPWIVRNYLVLHKVAFSHAGLGWALWVGAQDFKDQFYPHWDQEPVKSEIRGAASLGDIDRIFFSKAIEIIRRSPAAYLANCAKKFVRFWIIPPAADIISGKSAAAGMLYRAWCSLLVLFAVAGIFLADKRNFAFALFLAVMLYVSVFHAVLIMEPRYALPVWGFVFIFAAGGFFRKGCCSA